ncbi:hypothetical protein F4811DRAFT_522328 [Daldinia bambusicola]|nr:hypothetical protein F4811DRAFT_522328 [Daldinia bambusicola]
MHGIHRLNITQISNSIKFLLCFATVCAFVALGHSLRKALCCEKTYKFDMNQKKIAQLMSYLPARLSLTLPDLSNKG